MCGSVGAAESWMLGHWRTDDLTALLRHMLRNREVLDGLGLSSDYAIRYPASDVMLDTGHELVIGGATYRVREVRLVGDGSEARASLTRLS